MAKLYEPEQKTINFDDPTDEILCFTYDIINIYVGHKNSKITVFVFFRGLEYQKRKFCNRIIRTRKFSKFNSCS